MNKMPIPTALFDTTRELVREKSIELNLKINQEAKLVVKLIELWMFIYDNQEDLDFYVNLPKTILKKFKFNANNKRLEYYKLLELLENGNLIDVNDKYSVGNFSKSYRIKTDFIKGNYTELELSIKKIFKDYKSKSFWISKYPKFRKQIEEAYNINIELNNYIKWLMSNKGMELPPYFKNGVMIKRYLDSKTIFNYIYNAIKVNLGIHWFRISNEGRFYSRLTNTSNTALNFIKLNDKPIYELDVSCCQPLLLSNFIKSDEFRKDCESGLFYDKIGKELNYERSKVKLLSYKYIFFKKDTLNSGVMYDVMEKLYPSVMEQINNLKIKYGNLACELQKLESEVFVNNLSFMDVDMMLRHDAIYVHEENIDMMKKEIKKQFNKIGLTPKIK